MSREIKFRAWDKDEKEMLYFDDMPDEVEITLDADGQFILLAEGRDDCVTGCQYYHIDYELMQFTGLKDANDKEIYEGDVCSIERYYDDIHGNEKTYLDRFEVYFHEGVFAREDNLDCLSGCSTHCEVIGNIYENPELLED